MICIVSVASSSCCQYCQQKLLASIVLLLVMFKGSHFVTEHSIKKRSAIPSGRAFSLLGEAKDLEISFRPQRQGNSRMSWSKVGNLPAVSSLRPTVHCCYWLAVKELTLSCHNGVTLRPMYPHINRDITPNWNPQFVLIAQPSRPPLRSRMMKR